MFSYRRLFLTVTMLASIVLADILVQPGNEYQSGGSPRFLQNQPQYQSPAQHYRAQIPNQESARYLVGADVHNVHNVQTLYPHYDSYQDGARSHLLRYPHRLSYHRYHYLPRPHHTHFAKIGGHGYVRPSLFVGYPHSLTVHNRYKRSRPTSIKSDPTSIESSKSEVVAHDNDVAAKSTLTDAENPTTIDSLLPEHEPTNTNDKHVKNRQIPNDQMMKPRLFGLYPEKLYNSKHQLSDTPNKMQHMGPRFHSTDPNLNTQSSIVSTQQITDFQKSRQHEANMEMSNTNKLRQNKFTLQLPSYPKKSPKVYQCTDTSNIAVTTTSVPSQSFISNVQNRYRNNEELSGTYKPFDAPYFDRIDESLPNDYSYYSNNYPYYFDYNPNKYSNEAYSYFDSIDGIKSPIRIPDYILYPNISAWNNLTPMTSQTQFLDTYNYSPEKNIQAASSDYKYYDKTYPSDTLYDTFSSPVYY